MPKTTKKALVAEQPAVEPAEPKAPAPQAPAKTKLAILAELLQRSGGASIEEMMQATGWQAHSVRGALAGGLKKKGLAISSAKTEAGRRYHIVTEASR